MKTHDYGKLSHSGANCTICRLVLFAGIHQNFKQAALPLGMRRGAECTRKAFALHAQSMRLAGDAPDDSQHETTKRALTRRTECGHVRRISVACAGKLTVATSPELEDAVRQLGTGAVNFDIDLSELEYISSAGLRLLVALQRQAKAGDHVLVIRNVNKVVQEVFKISGFNKKFTVL